MKVIYDIRISFEHPPIPERHSDYRAARSNWEPGEPEGWGRTPVAALAELLLAEEEAALCAASKSGD